MGGERERLQRARPPHDLPVSRLRRARPGAQARAGARPGHRAVRHPRWRRWSTRATPCPTWRASSGQGALGPYGFRDALDYTRPEPGRRFAVVQNYMAHHIGMSHGGARQRAAVHASGSGAFTPIRWCGRRSCCCTSASRAASCCRTRRSWTPRRRSPSPELRAPAVREIDTPHTPQPHVALLGSAPYTVMVSHCGGGYSRYERLAVTRWRADGTRDDTGQFCYVQGRRDRARMVGRAPADLRDGRLVPRPPGHRPRHLPSRRWRRSRPAPRSPSSPATRPRCAA